MTAKCSHPSIRINNQQPSRYQRTLTSSAMQSMSSIQTICRRMFNHRRLGKAQRSTGRHIGRRLAAGVAMLGCGMLAGTLVASDGTGRTVHCDNNHGHQQTTKSSNAANLNNKKNIQALATHHWREELLGKYEDRLRRFSSPEKVFGYFASVELEGEFFMTSEDLLRSLLPYDPRLNGNVGTNNFKYDSTKFATIKEASEEDFKTYTRELCRVRRRRAREGREKIGWEKGRERHWKPFRGREKRFCPREFGSVNVAITLCHN